MQGPRVAADGGRPLRIALLSYRSKPHCGGQGVYVRHLSRELANLGHQVEVLSGPPYPNLDAGVGLTHLPSLDLYRDEDPFRVSWPSEFRTWVDALEFGIMCTAGFPEPLTFSLRAYQELKTRDVLPDVIHDNQTLGYGMLLMQRDGMPIIANVHHPITVDRELDLAASPLRKKWSKIRWYSFLRMQKRVIQKMPTLVTVSELEHLNIGRAKRVLARRPPGAPPTESLLETIALQIARTVPGLGEPVRQHVVRWATGNFIARLDLCWPDDEFFFELDGQHHENQPVYDARRQTAVVAATGWLPGRFTWHELTRTPRSAARRMSDVVEQARRRRPAA